MGEDAAGLLGLDVAVEHPLVTGIVADDDDDALDARAEELFAGDSDELADLLFGHARLFVPFSHHQHLSGSRVPSLARGRRQTVQRSSRGSVLDSSSSPGGPFVLSATLAAW